MNLAICQSYDEKSQYMHIWFPDDEDEEGIV